MIVSRRAVAFALAVPVLLLAGGCTTPIGPERASRTFRYVVEEAEKPEVRTELGLALSGGGIRSALYSIGVLKALHDQGILEKVDIISTVSGGSYAGYWLYSNALAKPRESLGAASFGPRVLGENMCELVTRANFVTNWDYVATPFLLKSYPTMYAEHIGRTFGYADKDLTPINGFESTRESPRPYLIVNATVHQPTPLAGWADGLFEMTPRLYGNEALGYHAWNAQAPQYRHAVGASGAAKDILKREFSFVQTGGRKLDVTLTDGGNSENLGALALIRRGVKTIIVADGEHNPDYRFEAYVNLKERLKNWGLALSSETLDLYLETRERGSELKPDRGLHWAKVVRLSDPEQKVISRIAYLKMVMTDIRHRPEDAQESMQLEVAAGRKIDDDFFNHLRATSTPSGMLRQSRHWNCSQARDVSASFQPWFRYNLHGYHAYSEGSRSYSLLRKLGGPFDSNFPAIYDA